MADTDRPSVLVVDDEKAIADLYADWLAADYDVECAHDGEGAIRALDGSPDVVLLDRRMPGRSGDDLIPEIRDRGLDARIAMVTAIPPSVDVVEMGFDDYLMKPVTGDQLRGMVERLHRVGSFDDELQRLYALVAKKAVLEAEQPPGFLTENDEYVRLSRRVARIRERLEELGAGLDSGDFDALFRGLVRPDDGSSAST